MKRLALLSLLFVVSIGLFQLAAAAPSEPSVAVTPNTATAVTQQRTYSLQCKEPACARFYKAALITDGGPAIDCAASSTATNLPVDNAGVTSGVRGARFVFQTGGLDRIKVVAADGGNPLCSLAVETVNTSSP